ncbi:hypothetical protein [Parasphingopyxis sp.]|uniref:hypothetical protein n=1 Tax=Parasphingopyxis sp. TaxID=1920299 RepID=UPI002627A925|nr:hypothetical protein [Parasphingopyxis sp.]
MSARDRLEDARRAERDARANWFRSLDIAKQRLAPNAIAKDAVGQFKDGASSAVRTVSQGARKRRGTIIGVGVAVGLFLLRKPIAEAVRSRLSKNDETGDDFSSLPEQRIDDQAGNDESPAVTKITEEV